MKLFIVGYVNYCGCFVKRSRVEALEGDGWKPPSANSTLACP